MSEVEKMYENAGVKKLTLDCYYNQPFCCKRCNHYKDNENCKYQVVKETYPSFTAEKQLKIIAFLVNKGYNVTFANLSNKFSLEQISKSLALCINSKWNNLTESEQEQIRSILNG